LGKVVVVVEENAGYSSVIGNSAMPYLNSLANQYGLATQYYADTHPSIGNYMMMTTGQIVTNNDSFNGPVSVDNIVRHLLTAGKTWKAYAESLPSVGYTGGDTGLYLHRHAPLTYFTDVVNSSVQKLNLVPLTQFAIDLNANQLPDFSFVTPNMVNDAHNGPLSGADAWLQTNIGPLLNNADFQKNGLLIILFDEAATSDATHGGGQVALVAVGPLVKKGQSATVYQHENLLKTIANYLGIDGNIGAAGSAAPMSDLVQ
jgi:acid phosphatase